MTTSSNAPLPSRAVANLFSCDPNVGYDDWQRIIAAAWLSGVPANVINAWSAQSAKYRPGIDDVENKQFNRTHGEQVTAEGTLAYYAGSQGPVFEMPHNPGTASNDQLAETLKYIIPYRPEDLANLPPVLWYAKGLIAQGATTLIHGDPKTGKSSLITHLVVKRHWDGADLSPDTKFWLFVEEGKVAIRERYDRYGLAMDGTSWGQATFWERASVEDWTPTNATMEIHRAYFMATQRPAIIVIDTLLHWAAFTDANDAANVVGTLNPYLQLANHLPGVGMVFLHQSRKSGGRNNVQSILGSQQLAASFDTVVHLDRDEDKTIANITSRLLADPARITYRQAIDANTGYMALDFLDGDIPAIDNAAVSIRNLLAAKSPLTPAEIMTETGYSRTSVYRTLTELVEQNICVRIQGNPPTYGMPNQEK